MAHPDAETPTLKIKAMLLRELSHSWARMNHALFRKAMVPPVIEWSEAERRLGSWNRADRRICISWRLARESSWEAVKEILKHEMAHQYVDEVLGAADEVAHGPAFQHTCQRLGIDGRAAGSPKPSSAEEDLIRKIRGLLALAESPNLFEAQSAAATAQRLMLRHNINGSAHRNAFENRWLGECKARFEAHQKLIAGLLTEHFFVQAIWVESLNARTARRGRILEVSGTAENLEMCSYVHYFLLETSERLWQQRQPQTVDHRKERREFLTGVIRGFSETLRQSKDVNERQGLVWTGAPLLEEHTAKRHPHQRTTRITLNGGSAYQEGQALGRKLILNRPLTESTGNRGHLLGPSRG